VDGSEVLAEVVVEGRRDRFFDKKHRRWAPCFIGLLGLLGRF